MTTTPDFLALDYLPPYHSGAGFIFGGSVVVLGAMVGAAIAYLFLLARDLHRTEIRDQKLIEDRTTMALLPGRGRVVHGRVEQDDGADSFRIEIIQKVKDCTAKSSRWHEWTERTRHVNVAPFYLVREDGVTVCVEPSERVLFLDSLETEYPENMPLHRIRRAEAKVGHELHAYGNLFEAPHPRAREPQGGDAYRGVATGLVLRAPQNGQLLLASEALRDRYRKRISVLRDGGIIIAIVWVIFHACFTAPFLITLMSGTRTTTLVTGNHLFITKNKNQETTHCVLETKTPDDGFALEGEVDCGVYQTVIAERARGHAVTIPLLRVGSSTFSSTFGTEANASGIGLMIALFLAPVPFGIVYMTYRSKFTWYDKKTVNEYGGTGHWIEKRTGKSSIPNA